MTLMHGLRVSSYWIGSSLAHSVYALAITFLPYAVFIGRFPTLIPSAAGAISLILTVVAAQMAGVWQVNFVSKALGSGGCTSASRRRASSSSICPSTFPTVCATRR